MVLVGTIQQVVGCDVQLGNLFLFQLNVGTCREAEQRVGRCLGFRIVGTIDVRLLQVAVEVGSDVEVVK